jgi:hypothetical protein
MGLYPNPSKASVIECPVHRFTVALNDAGRIATTCPACIIEARLARRRWADRKRRQLAAV